MHRIVRAAALAGLMLGAAAAPALANALDSQLQPVAQPIPRETVSFDGNEAPGTIVVKTGERALTPAQEAKEKEERDKIAGATKTGGRTLNNEDEGDENPNGDAVA